VLLQLDEPSLPAVLDGAVPSASGFRRLAPVEPGPAADGLGAILRAAGVYTVVHCCATGVPFGIIRQSGARGVSFDLSLLRAEDEDRFAEAVEAGTGMFAGVIQPAGTGRPQPSELAKRVIDRWLRIGLPPRRCTEQVVITPACGLAGASPERATAVLAACQEAARLLPELIEEGTP
jgi:methionine synthase II (cobalamin-independent)